jgi:hypothetical protein
MTFERRLQKLESRAASRMEDDDPSMAWLSAAPEPVQRYVAGLVDEYRLQVDEGKSKDSAGQGLLERHPLYRPLQSQLITAEHAGEFVSLRRAQAHVLYIAGKMLPFYAWPDSRWQRWRLIERDYTESICARSALGTCEEQATYDVEAWRESGTTDGDVLAAAGIGPLELELLAADD